MDHVRSWGCELPKLGVGCGEVTLRHFAYRPRARGPGGSVVRLLPSPVVGEGLWAWRAGGFGLLRSCAARRHLTLRHLLKRRAGRWERESSARAGGSVQNIDLDPAPTARPGRPPASRDRGVADDGARPAEGLLRLLAGSRCPWLCAGGARCSHRQDAVPNTACGVLGTSQPGGKVRCLTSNQC